MTDLDQTYTPERMKLVLDSTRLGMWDWNPQDNSVVFDENWAAMLGLSLDDLTMTLDDWSSRVHPDDLEACFADISAHLEGRTDFYENVHRMRHADGAWRYILDRGRVVERDSQGQAIRFTGTHADLTPLKEAEFRASLAIKTKDRFLSAMSHELRAPLHAIAGILEQVLDMEPEGPKRSLLDTAIDSSRLLSGLVDDIFDAANISSADIKFNITSFDLVELLENLHALFERRFDETDVVFLLNIDESAYLNGRLYVHSDRNRLNQILMNLLSNAWKYVDHGTVTLGLNYVENTQQWQLRVADTGPGIPDIDTLFSKFDTIEAVEPIFDGPNSTGLGLYICYHLSSMLKLPLNVQSSHGQGTCFTLDISEADTHFGPVQTTVGDTQDIDASLVGLSVLVVDDDPINRKVLSWQLSDVNASVEYAADGNQALRLCQAREFDVVLTDLHMPVMGGLALTRAIRAERALTRQPVIIVTSADASELAWPLCQDAGADAYLSKPFSLTQLKFSLYQEIEQTRRAV